jgi:hypothetical protein
MTLESVDLLNLAAVRQANILDAEVVVGIILVCGNLAPCPRLSASCHVNSVT